ncbi:acyl carrier protein [Streptomyces sp. NPDC047999]|uniref:acyl carrier protein n=1 Tax=Streptomyces sp. NPDC047999 TaxID=3365497 RepID=UPI003717BE20
MPEEMYDKVVSKLTGHLGVPADQVHPDVTFQDLDVDSLALAELLVIVETELGVKPDLTTQVEVTSLTVGAAARTLEDMVAERRGVARDVT